MSKSRVKQSVREKQYKNEKAEENAWSHALSATGVGGRSGSLNLPKEIWTHIIRSKKDLKRKIRWRKNDAKRRGRGNTVCTWMSFYTHATKFI